jgi:drug/metabolite transporter (DMT)-like permease
VNHVTDATGGGELHMNADSLKSLLSSPIIWGGLVLFGLSAIVWLFALSRASLSFAYPFAALSYVLIVLFSVLVLHEDVPVLRWIGVAFIVTGILLVAQTPHT